MKNFRLDWFGVGMAGVHVASASFILGQHFEGSWGGFLLFAIDFPASFLFFIPGVGSSPIAMIAIGSLWWYLVTVALRQLLGKIFKKSIHDHSA